MDNTRRFAQLFLESLRSTNAKEDSIYRLKQLLEALETKNDPDEIEIRLADSLYAFMEKLNILESNLNSYVKEKRDRLPETKLAELWDNVKGTGSIYRD